MALQLSCDCGDRPSPTDVWKDIPDSCDVCKKQIKVFNLSRTQAAASWEKK
jgi:hypothetical protein